jgi:hypothetical protein
MRRRDFIKGFGGVAAMPLAAHAQERAKPLVGFLSSRSPAESEGLVEAFRRGLGEAGFVDGQSVVITFRWAEGRYDRLEALAAELVGLGVAVLVAAGGDTVSTRGPSGDCHDPSRLHRRCRPSRLRSCREPEPAGQQCHRNERARV